MPRIALLLVAFVGLACTGRGVASEDSPLAVEPIAAEELPRPHVVEMHMAQPLAQEGGSYGLAFPGDRINPPRLPNGMRSGHDVAISVTIDTGIAARDVVSKSHRIVTEQRDDITRIRLADEDAIPNQDFVLSWKMGGDEPRAMKRWLFPKPASGSVLVTYPFVLEGG